MTILNSSSEFHNTLGSVSGNMRKAYVIDDDRDVRKSLHFMFAASNVSVRPFASADDFLEELRFLAPAPILLDIRMADIDGLQLLEILNDRAVVWPVIVLTAHAEVRIAVRAMKLGAIDFLEKPFAHDLLDQAMARAFDILDRTGDVLSARDQVRYRIGQLTSRERETLAILMEGVPNKEVAHRLGLSVRTVEMHRANALAKLKVRSIAEVVKMASVGGMTAGMDAYLENTNEN